MKGTEDLGEGLQAVFQLENGFGLGTGVSGTGGRLFGRQATVGLQSAAWGRLDFGRQLNIASQYFASVASPFGADFGQAAAGTTFGSAASIYYDNMIMYQTPEFSGLQFGIGYSFNVSGNQRFKISGGSEPSTRAITAGLRYANGPFAAALSYDQYKMPDAPFALGEGGVTVKAWNLGASYDFDVVKLHAALGQTRNGLFAMPQFAGVSDVFGDNFFAMSANHLKINSYTLGLSAPVGVNGSLFGSWAMADLRNQSTDKQQVYSLGYTYALSKRTNVYALGSYANHVGFMDDLKSTQVSFGLRHQF